MFNGKLKRENESLNNIIIEKDSELKTCRELNEELRKSNEGRQREITRLSLLVDGLNEDLTKVQIDLDSMTGSKNTWEEVASTREAERVKFMKQAEKLEQDFINAQNQIRGLDKTVAATIEERDTARRVAEGYRQEWEVARSLADDRTNVLNDTMDANELLKASLKEANEKIAELEKRRPNRGSNGRFQPRNQAKK